VFHVHFHLIPKPSEQEGLGVGWRPGELDAQAGAALAAELEQALG
jgi:diadenosine tetraphosphate (Ap4A) HIT family hydrolase